MKKISFAFLMASLLIISWACKKSTETPSVSFSVSALDSAKVSSLSVFAINNIIQNHIDSFFVSVKANTPTRIYNKTLFFKYTGGGSDFKIIYTGDVSHVYSPNNDSTANTAVTFPDGWYSYKYPKSDTFRVTVVSTNVVVGTNELKKAILTQPYIIK